MNSFMHSYNDTIICPHISHVPHSCSATHPVKYQGDTDIPLRNQRMDKVLVHCYMFGGMDDHNM